MMTDVVLQDVSLRYGKDPALEGVSCIMQAGNTYGLIGRNGAGKTSLLSLIASYRRPTGGTIRIGDEDPFENVDRMPWVHFVYSRDMSEEDDSVAVTLQHSARYRPTFDMDYALLLLDRFGLDPGRPVNGLSEGMQAAVNVIEGLASRAPVTCFDEVHHGMDAPSRRIFYEALLECRETDDRTFVLSTHLVSEMAYLFDHVLLLDHGRLMVDEPYDTIVDRGVTITGEANRVDSFAQGHTVIDRKVLGGSASVMLYGVLAPDESAVATEQGLDVSPVSLQELFIHLTKEENRHALDQR